MNLFAIAGRATPTSLLSIARHMVVQQSSVHFAAYHAAVVMAD